jgi:UDP-N-acetyl-D-mannosaminuronate dehydrogenase
MIRNPKFGPCAQTPEQRAWVLKQMQRVIPSLKTKATAYAQHLYSRYVAGELSWTQVREALDAAPITRHSY